MDGAEKADQVRRLLLHRCLLLVLVGEYSHGMKQKVGLVQALQHDPEVVILDEPTEGLDPLVQETFFALVSEASEAGRTVFLSSHVLSEVQRACGRVAIVRAGRLVTVEAVAALREARARRVRLSFPAGHDHGAVRWTGAGRRPGPGTSCGC
jgi:ABC-2 type transport system ATP-binding protein